MAERIRFGIIGCGVIGPFHAEALQGMESAELVAATDLLPERAEAMTAQFGGVVEPSIEALLARTDIDAVSICTPSGMHADHGMMAARAGKHVLSEKPLDVYVEKVDALIATCREHKVTLGGIFQNRFTRTAQQVKRIIEDGWLGEIVFANASCLWYRTQGYYDSAEWRGTWALDGGVLSNQGIHTLDRMLWLVGMQPKVVSAYCPTLKRDMEAEDLGIALLEFPNGAGGVVQGTTLANPGMSTEVTICGSKGSITFQGNDVVFFNAEGAPADLIDVNTAGGAGAAADPAAIGVGGHRVNMEEFVQAIREGRDPRVNGAEGRKAVQLLNDIYAAAGVGRWAGAKV